MSESKAEKCHHCVRGWVLSYKNKVFESNLVLRACIFDETMTNEARRVGGDADPTSVQRLLLAMQSAHRQGKTSGGKESSARDQAVRVAASLSRVKGFDHVVTTVGTQPHVLLRYRKGSLASLEAENGRLRCLAWRPAPGMAVGNAAGSMENAQEDTGESPYHQETWTWTSQHVFCPPDVLEKALQALRNRKQLDEGKNSLEEEVDCAVQTLRDALTNAFGQQWTVVAVELPHKKKDRNNVALAGVVTAKAGRAFSLRSDKMTLIAWQQSVRSEEAQRLVTLAKFVAVLAAMVLVIIVAGLPQQLRDRVLQHGLPFLAFLYLLYKTVWKYGVKSMKKVVL